MPTVTILVGAPGSGKSTHAKTLQATYINQDKQGRDHLRLFGEALAKGEDIVVDRMNFDKSQRDRYIVPAKAAGYSVDIKVFIVPRKVCYDRVVVRVGHETIKDETAARSAINLFFAKYTKPTDEEGKVEFITYESQDKYVSTTKPRAVVCDLDGTLADISHRLHFVQGEGKKNWPSFMRGIPRDAVKEPIAEILRRYSGDHEIVYCSGRSEDEREVTEKWLKENGLWFHHLMMRSKNDHRPDDLVKEILLDFDLLPQFEIQMILDDRDQVVSMWRRRGFTCLQVAPGNF